MKANSKLNKNMVMVATFILQVTFILVCGKKIRSMERVSSFTQMARLKMVSTMIIRFSHNELTYIY